MATHYSHGALPFPVRAGKFTLPLVFLDADGDPISPGTLDSEISKDGGAFADCTNEVTYVSNGFGFLTLTETEMDCSVAGVVVKGDTSGYKNTVATISPRVLPSVHSGTAVSIPSSTSITLAATANSITGSAYTGLLIRINSATAGAGQVRVITDYVAGTQVATISPAWETDPTGTVTYDVLRPESIGYQNANVIAWAGTAVAAVDTAGYPKVTIKSGSGTGEVSLSSGGVTLSTSGLSAAADAVLDEALSGHTTAGSVGSMLQPIAVGTLTTGASAGGTTAQLAVGSSAVDDYYNNHLLHIIAGTGAGQSQYVSDYVGATRTVTINGTWTAAVSTDSVYVLRPGGSIPGASAPSASDNAAAVWNALAASYVAAGSFGARLKPARQSTLGATGTALALTLDGSASTTTDYFKYQGIRMLTGVCAGQSRQIISYSTGRVATVSLAFTGTPASGDEYLIFDLGIDAATVDTIADAVWDEARSGHATAGTFGEYTPADVVRLSGDATAADNAEAFFDGTGYAGTGNVIPTVTTLTGHTPQTGDAFARLGAPAGASVSADVAAIKSDSAAILVDTGTTLDGKVDAILADTGTDGVVVATASKSGYALSTAGIDALYTRQLTESYAADGAAPTVAQALMQIQQMLTEFGISATTMTVKKLDGTTTAFTLTLNDGSAPTAITRAT